MTAEAVPAVRSQARRVSARTSRDAVLNGAVELAREAAQEVAERPQDVGEHLGTALEDDRVVSHRFAAAMKGYRGWHWTVTLARIPRSRSATVSEVELLPGDEAILAPEWLPWSERLRPGDIGTGDVLPFRPDDPRLEPGFVPTGDPEVDEVAIDELALARARVLSPQGRDEAADRWYRGTRGPTAPGAVAAAAECVSCGYFIPLQGALGQLFGVCANPWSPDDGKVVSVDHGCGAHSETDVDPQPSDWPAPAPIIDEHGVELVTLPDGDRSPRARRAPDDVVAEGAAAAAQDVAVAEPVVVEPVTVEPAAGAGPVVEPVAEPEPEPDAVAEPEPVGAEAVEPEPVVAEPAPKRRRTRAIRVAESVVPVVPVEPAESVEPVAAQTPEVVAEALVAAELVDVVPEPVPSEMSTSAEPVAEPASPVRRRRRATAPAGSTARTSEPLVIIEPAPVASVAPAAPEQAEPAQAEPAQAEPAQAEPAQSAVEPEAEPVAPVAPVRRRRRATAPAGSPTRATAPAVVPEQPTSGSDGNA
ncbi:DUF3027 domain-containing protein [Antribacter gilvus]|uniref:DUF3027 domain-containing protein n=1 Tax=Antribacter gilvus TaxID=2304675 RepID=UPI0023E80CF1|nr:DUF3027 domain-containing protein [Antribacter gilvus]